MAYDHGEDDGGLIEAARKHLAAAALDEGAAEALAELVSRYETLLAENRRLVRISDQISSDLKLEAHTDKQTGVFNRGRFIEIAEHELERAIRFERPMSILLIKVDALQALQDRFAETASDAVLKTLAAAGLGVLRRIDSFARVEDDGFAALLPETDTTGAVILAERLREAVANMGVAVGEESIEFTVSIGVVSRSASADKAEALLQKADEALALKRGERGNRVAVAT